MPDLRRRNRKILGVTLGVVLGMVVLSFASVPIYRRLCQVTGWGGTTQRDVVNNSMVSDREIIVQFNADTDPNLPWVFKPDLRQVKVKIGADALIAYSAENTSDAVVTGTAIHNVTPLQAGKYFHKTQCFCFGEQSLQPHQKVQMPVTFFVDPAILEDRDLKDLKTITLSYVFYRHQSPELEKATEKFYNEPTIN
jgi:cytochrome c oxidase assembly protein subunit 11